MNDGKLIYEKIPLLVEDAEAIGKLHQNEQQKFMFRGIDDVLNMVHPLLAKHKVFVTTTVQDEQREERQTQRGGTLFYTRLKCLFRFFTTDGSFVESTIIGEAMDSGDKSSAKALSIAFKYALFQLLCIPTQETDADAEAHEAGPKRVVLSPQDLKYVTDMNMEIDGAESSDVLRRIGEKIKEQPEHVTNELRGFYVARMKALKTEESLQPS